MAATTSEDRSLGAQEPVGTLGTFGGVFTPSILTILGLVLFLRVAYVVGSVGLVRALLILGLATSVSVLTSISLAVVATNMRVRGGGEYFLISRTLGIEFGGAVGVVLVPGDLGLDRVLQHRFRRSGGRRIRERQCGACSS